MARSHLIMPGDADRERGGAIVLTVVLMVVLLGAAALAVDVGVLYTARAQCQNAADAGALACGGHMLTFNPLDQSAVPQLQNKGAEYSNYHTVLSEQVTITPGDVSVDLSQKRCRVCVPRTVARGNPVPTFFAKIFNRQWVDVSACATAEANFGSTTACLKPWALPDAWDDADLDGEYDPGEYYEAGVTSYGTNYRMNDRDVGTILIVKQADPQDAIAPGQFFPIDLPIADSPDTGGARYRDNIANCNAEPVSIGDILYTENGNMIGPTKQGVEELISRDPGAYWDEGANQIANSAYGDNASPRIIRIPFFDPAFPPVSGKVTVQVTNIASLFLESITGSGVVTCRIMLASGSGVGNTPGALQSVRLVE